MRNCIIVQFTGMTDIWRTFSFLKCSFLSEELISYSISLLYIKRNKYKVYVIDEFRTSKLCNGCENELSKFLDVSSKKPKSKNSGKMYKSYGILRCQSSTQVCNVIHNRDRNAVKNMLKIVSHYQATGERLQKYSRKIQLRIEP